jgi:ABC-type enterobactin transport system permease subunit
MKNEPVVLGGLVTGLVTAVLALVIAFGVDLTQEQQVAILGVVTALIALVAWLVRRKTYGPETEASAMKPSPEDLTGPYVVGGEVVGVDEPKAG